MSVSNFPKILYKGDSVNTYFYIQEGSGKYNFKVGDVVILGIKKKLEDDEYVLHKKFIINAEGTDLAIKLTSEETKNIPIEEHAILEIKLICEDTKIIKTVYQDRIYLKGVVINE